MDFFRCRAGVMCPLFHPQQEVEMFKTRDKAIQVGFTRWITIFFRRNKNWTRGIYCCINRVLGDIVTCNLLIPKKELKDYQYTTHGIYIMDSRRTLHENGVSDGTEITI